MVTLKINDKEVTVEDGTLILDAAKEVGVEIPTFCYQANLSGLGSCRMCLVEIEGQRKLQPSCVTPVMAEMSVKTDSETVTSARASMFEFLLSNHAMDCPVCDKGGECELQDMVYKHGPKKGRHSESKVRYHDKDYALSPVIMKNSNRCVQCMRCVRVCHEVVGKGVLDAIGRGAHQEETSFLRTFLDCDHDGMCIEVCPVGCFMRRPYRYKARPWDLKGAKTVCPYCATGCRTTIEERDGVVLRSIARPDDGFNGKMLCARGRFGYEIVNSAERLTTPLLKKNGVHEEVSWDEAVSAITERLGNSKDGGKTGGIASARLTNEELYTFQKLMRTVVGTGNIDSGSRWDPAVAAAFASATGITSEGTSVYDAADSGTVFVIGGQLSEENPVTDYIIRYRSGMKRTSVIIASPRAMKLDSSARLTLRHAPAGAGPLMKALAAVISGAGKASGKEVSGVSTADIKAAAGVMKVSESVAIMVGTDLLRYREGIGELTLLIDTLKKAGKEVRVMPLLDRANQRGAWDMGVHPGFGPGYGAVDKGGLGCDAMLEAAAKGELENMYIAGEDVVGSYPDAGFAKEAIGKLKFLVVQDIFLTETAKMADVVLPGASYAEKDGTFTNQEGRVQPVSALLPPPGKAKRDLEIMAMVGSALDPSGKVFSSSISTSASAVFEEISAGVAAYSGVEPSGGDNGNAFVKAGAGLKGPGDFKAGATGGKPKGLALMTGNHLFHSGRLSMRAGILKGLMEEPVVEISEKDAERLGLNGGDRVKVKGGSFEAELTLRTKEGSFEGVAFIAENFEAAPANGFFKRGETLPDVTITRVEG
ncbi:MAG: NADH-quinone oxidoreductase subunit NuoG [Thermodesulfobacteriota bacterium]